MNPEPPAARSPSELQAEAAFKDWVRRVVKGAAELGVDLDEHIALVIQAMSSIADTLGLAGVQETAISGQ